MFAYHVALLYLNGIPYQLAALVHTTDRMIALAGTFEYNGKAPLPFVDPDTVTI